MLQSGQHASLIRFTFAFPSVKSRFRFDGGRSSMVELQIVVLAVAGSSPVGRPPTQQSNPLLSKSERLNCRHWTQYPRTHTVVSLTTIVPALPSPLPVTSTVVECPFQIATRKFSGWIVLFSARRPGILSYSKYLSAL